MNWKYRVEGSCCGLFYGIPPAKNDGEKHEKYQNN